MLLFFVALHEIYNIYRNCRFTVLLHFNAGVRWRGCNPPLPPVPYYCITYRRFNAQARGSDGLATELRKSFTPTAAVSGLRGQEMEGSRRPLLVVLVMMRDGGRRCRRNAPFICTYALSVNCTTCTPMAPQKPRTLLLQLGKVRFIIFSYVIYSILTKAQRTTEGISISDTEKSFQSRWHSTGFISNQLPNWRLLLIDKEFCPAICWPWL